MKRMVLLMTCFLVIYLQYVSVNPTFATDGAEHDRQNMFVSESLNGNEEMTRGEVVVIVARALHLDMPISFTATFQDVSMNDLYYNAVAQLTSLGVIDNATYFHPQQLVNRAQIAKILTLAYHIETNITHNSTFQDVSEEHWATKYISAMAQIGVMEGIDAQHFAPNRHMTRAQLATIMKRMDDFQVRLQQRQIVYDPLVQQYIETVNDSNVWADEVVNLVNVQRQQQQLEPLVVDPHLTQIAIIKAQDMIQSHYFTHESPFYGQPWDLATVFHYDFTSYGENIAKNFDSPQAVVDAWMQSPKHQENILKSSYSYIGVGIKKNSDGNYYWVQHFASK